MKRSMFPRRSLPVLLAALVVAAAGAGACSDQSAEAVAALRVEDAVAYWSVRGRVEDNNYIRPVVRFRVRNAGSEPVGYIQAMAVFRRENAPEESWGNAFAYSIAEEPIPPGGTSELITLRSDANYISKDAPEKMFDNPEWRQVFVEIFLRVGSSNWRPVQKMEVPKRIGAPEVEKFLKPPVPERDQSPPSGR